MEKSHRVLSRTSNHRYRRFDDEGIVVLLERGEVLAVNGLGAFLLELWSDASSIERAAEQVTASYAVERDVAVRDVSEFADEMVALGVLDERGPA
jgi:hypothetical protein